MGSNFYSVIWSRQNAQPIDKTVKVDQPDPSQGDVKEIDSPASNHSSVVVSDDEDVESSDKASGKPEPSKGDKKEAENTGYRWYPRVWSRQNLRATEKTAKADQPSLSQGEVKESFRSESMPWISNRSSGQTLQVTDKTVEAVQTDRRQGERKETVSTGSPWYTNIWSRQNVNVQATGRTANADQPGPSQAEAWSKHNSGGQTLHVTERAADTCQGYPRQRGDTDQSSFDTETLSVGSTQCDAGVLGRQSLQVIEGTVNVGQPGPKLRESKETDKMRSHWYPHVWGRQLSQPTDRTVKADHEQTPSQGEEPVSSGAAVCNKNISGGQNSQVTDSTGETNAAALRQAESKEFISQCNTAALGRQSLYVMEGTVSGGQPDPKLRESKESYSTGSPWYSSLWGKQNVHSVQTTDRAAKVDQPGPSRTEAKDTARVGSTWCNTAALGRQSLQVMEGTVNVVQPDPKQRENKETESPGYHWYPRIWSRQNLHTTDRKAKADQPGPDQSEAKEISSLGTTLLNSGTADRQNLPVPDTCRRVDVLQVEQKQGQVKETVSVGPMQGNTGVLGRQTLQVIEGTVNVGQPDPKPRENKETERSAYNWYPRVWSRQNVQATDRTAMDDQPGPSQGEVKETDNTGSPWYSSLWGRQVVHSVQAIDRTAKTDQSGPFQAEDKEFSSLRILPVNADSFGRQNIPVTDKTVNSDQLDPRQIESKGALSRQSLQVMEGTGNVGQPDPKLRESKETDSAGYRWYPRVWSRQNVQATDRTVKADQSGPSQGGIKDTASVGPTLGNTGVLGRQSLQVMAGTVDVSQPDPKFGETKERGDRQNLQPLEERVEAGQPDLSKGEIKEANSRGYHWYPRVWSRQNLQATDGTVKADQPGSSHPEEPVGVGSTQCTTAALGGQSLHVIEGTVSVGQPDPKLRESKESSSTISPWYSSLWGRQNVHSVQATDRTAKAEEPGPSQTEAKDTVSVGSTQANAGVLGRQSLEVMEGSVNVGQPDAKIKETKGILDGQNLQTVERKDKTGQQGTNQRESKETSSTGSTWYSSFWSRQNVHIVQDRTAKVDQADRNQREIRGTELLGSTCSDSDVLGGQNLQLKEKLDMAGQLNPSLAETKENVPSNSVIFSGQNLEQKDQTVQAGQQKLKQGEIKGAETVSTGSRWYSGIWSLPISQPTDRTVKADQPSPRQGEVKDIGDLGTTHSNSVTAGGENLQQKDKAETGPTDPKQGGVQETDGMEYHWYSGLWGSRQNPPVERKVQAEKIEIKETGSIQPGNSSIIGGLSVRHTDSLAESGQTGQQQAVVKENGSVRSTNRVLVKQKSEPMVNAANTGQLEPNQGHTTETARLSTGSHWYPRIWSRQLSQPTDRTVKADQPGPSQGKDNEPGSMGSTGDDSSIAGGLNIKPVARTVSTGQLEQRLQQEVKETGSVGSHWYSGIWGRQNVQPVGRTAKAGQREDKEPVGLNSVNLVAQDGQNIQNTGKTVEACHTGQGMIKQPGSIGPTTDDSISVGGLHVKPIARTVSTGQLDQRLQQEVKETGSVGNHWYSGIWGRQNVQSVGRTAKAGQKEDKEAGGVQSANLSALDGQNLQKTDSQVEVGQTEQGMIKETGTLRPTDTILVKQNSESTANVAKTGQLDPNQRETKEIVRVGSSHSKLGITGRPVRDTTVESSQSDPSQGETKETVSTGSPWYTNIWSRQNVNVQATGRTAKADQPGPSQGGSRESSIVGITHDDPGIAGEQDVKPTGRTVIADQRQPEIKETVRMGSTQGKSGIVDRRVIDVAVESSQPDTSQKETKVTSGAGSPWYSSIWGRQNVHSVQATDRTAKGDEPEPSQTEAKETSIVGINHDNSGIAGGQDVKPTEAVKMGSTQSKSGIVDRRVIDVTVESSHPGTSQKETKETASVGLPWYTSLWGGRNLHSIWDTDRPVKADEPGPSQTETKETSIAGITLNNSGIAGGQDVKPTGRTVITDQRQPEIKETVKVESSQSNSAIAGRRATDITVESSQSDTSQRETKETESTRSPWYSSIWSRQNVHIVQATDRTAKADEPGPSQTEAKESVVVRSSHNNSSAVGGQNSQATETVVKADKSNSSQKETTETGDGRSGQLEAGIPSEQNLKPVEGRVKVDQPEPSQGEAKQTGCLGSAPWYSCILSRQNLQLIDRTVKAGQEDPAQEEVKEITKKHWVNAKSRTRCFRKDCRRRFSFVEKPHHCRRCGEVFCVSCVQWKRKLNTLAKPDPDGKECRVCQACFELEPQEIGCTRDHIKEFWQVKLTSQAYQTAKVQKQKQRGWRNRYELDMECARLVKGFGEELQRWDIAKALIEMRKMVIVPYWQRGDNWLQEATRTSCGACETPFNLLFNKKSHCRVCAMAVCFNCSSRRLIVYVPNSEVFGERRPWNWLTLTQEYREPRLAVIEIVGCPEEEPEICLYLRVCDRCLKALTEIQVREQGISLTIPEEDFLARLTSVWEEFSLIQEGIDDRLHKFSSTIDLLEDNTASDAAVQDSVRLVDKLENDLTDFFTAYSGKVEQLKKFRRAPSSPAQAKLLQNFIKAKCEYYVDNTHTFRCMKKKMAEVSPPETTNVDGWEVVSSS